MRETGLNLTNKTLSSATFQLIAIRQDRQHWRAESHAPPQSPLPPSLFCVAKRKKENKGKKERLSKQKLLKSFYQDQNVTVLVMVVDNTFQCPMAPPY